MVKIRHLPNAPIIEAIIDLKVKLPPDFHIEQISNLKDRLHARYPLTEERHSFESGVEISHGKQVSQFTKELGLQGFLLKSADGHNVAQFKVDGFSFSRLSPYTSWDVVHAEAYDLWKLYAEAAMPEYITRIAVRYINRWAIPEPVEEFPQYLKAPPKVPGFTAKDVKSFLTRIVVNEPELDITANITQAFEKSVQTAGGMIILDIDVYKERQFSIDDEQVWATFEELRNMKNRIFFDSITEKTARLFK